MLSQIQSVTHPDATFSHVATSRYLVEARLFEGVSATDTLREFDVLMPSHLGNDAIERLLNRVTGDRYQVRSKTLQTCGAF